jgi:homoserine dehydrogenase
MEREGLPMKEIGIGLLGFGTVGAGVVAGLEKNGAVLAARLDAVPVLRAIADVDLDRDRGVTVDRSLLTTDAEAVIRRPDVDVVIELIGGTGVARRFVKAALELGKPVVTANKALLAECGREIFALAAEKQADVYFGASVGGGIPIVRALREGLVANRIESIYGILNGTCNYILTRMETERMAFETALKEAQKKGYAEADPALDIDGVDTAHKAAILASLAYGFNVPMASVSIEGIRNLSATDLTYAQKLGYRIKLLAVIKRSQPDGSEPAIEVRVHPTLIPLDHMLASVSGVYNAAMVTGDLSGRTLYYGRGAGREPTASTVLADVADGIRNLVKGSKRRVPPIQAEGTAYRVLPIEAIRSRYYLRMALLDKPGMLGQITSVLGRHDIGIASVLQPEAHVGRSVPVVMVTHEAGERDVVSALQEMDAMAGVGGPTVRMRIED